MHACRICQKPDAEKPMTFRGTDWCCEMHRKMTAGEVTREQFNELLQKVKL